MSKNKSDQNAHEEQVFNDVLKLSMVSGGYKKKAALKVGGSINAGSECPDIVITRENGSIVGLEHFRIDHNIKHGRNAQSKSAELTSAMKADYEKLVPRLKVDSVSSEEMASLAANYVSLAKYHQSCACCDDLTRSLDARLFGGKTGHASKLPKYRNHLTELSGDDGRIELGYLIEIHSDFQGLFMHDGTRVARLVSGQCPLYAEIYDLLFKSSCEVDWILIGFYPCLTDQIVNAAIIDCRNNMFKESCRRQRLKRTEYLGLGKTEPFLKQSRVGETEIELCGDKVNITIEIDTKRIDCNLPALHLLNLIQKNIDFAGTAFRFFCDVVVKRFCSTGVAEAHGLKIGLNNVLCGNIALEEHVLDLTEKDCFSTAPDSNQNFDQILIDKRNDLIQITFAQNHRASPHILILAYNYCCVNSIVLFY